VVDDGSTDKTWRLLTEPQARLPKLVPVKNEVPLEMMRWGPSISKRYDEAA
jgi:hypothetical protein